MAETKTSPWREKAGTLLTSSSMKIRALANKAGTAAAGAAEATGSRVKTTWETTRQEWSTKVQPRVNAGLNTAARVTAETGAKIKTGFIEVRDKAAATKVGQQISETTRASFEKSKTLLARVNFGQRNRKDENSVFGLPLEVMVQRQAAAGKPVPRIVALCADYLTARGLTTEYLFENEGNSQAVMRLMKLFDQDASASIPLGTSSLDVAQLLKVYFRSLPEPVLTYALYDAIVEVGGTNVQRLRELIGGLPAVNQATLECITELLQSVGDKSAFNKMDARFLATEFAPLLIWKPGAAGGVSSPTDSGPLARIRSIGSDPEMGERGSGSPLKATSKEVPLLDNEATPSVISQTNGEDGAIEPDSPGQGTADDQQSREQNGIVEAVLCLIEQHEAIFTNLRPHQAS